MNIKFRFLLSAVIAVALALPGLTSADNYGHGYYKHGQKQKHGHKKHHRQGNRYDGGYEYSNKPITHYYNRDNSQEKLLIGLLVGGITGYAISNSQKRRTYGYPPNYAPEPPAATYPSGGYQYSHNTCLQKREYQTTVIVGGRNVPAYGTACLQPDGSWLSEPAQLAPY